jgi:hypothetical protein
MPFFILQILLPPLLLIASALKGSMYVSRKYYPSFFEKKIIFDSINLVNPDIQVSRLRLLKNVDTSTDEDIFLPQEMGRVYKSIQDALQVLKVNSFRINNGKFTLINRMAPDEMPVTITHIQFHLDNLQVDTSSNTGSHKILFSDNVALQTHHQDILFLMAGTG